MEPETKPAVPLEYEPSTARLRPGLRWWICALLFAATTINYMDRSVTSVLKPTFIHDLRWNEIDYSNIVFWFQAAYAAGYLFGGRMMDRLGLRWGYALAMLLWSLSAMGHAFVATVVGFSVARFCLGLSEGGNFPAAVKTVGEWFPRKERALATGIFNSGSNIGAILTPLLVPWIALNLGWPASFLLTGAAGLACMVAWMVIYRPPEQHPQLSHAELAHIRSDPLEPAIQIPWAALLRYRTTWAFMLGMVLTSPIWWFYLNWAPGFFADKHKLDLKNIGPPLIAIYLIADFGSIAGGWMSSWMIQRGWSVNASRKITMLVCVLCVVPVFFAPITASKWTATLLIALAAGAHQGFASNLYTLVSDTMPRSVVSSVVGIGGLAGGIAGMLSAKIIGYVLEWTHSYVLLFGFAPVSYALGLIAIQLLLPRIVSLAPEERGDKTRPERSI